MNTPLEPHLNIVKLDYAWGIPFFFFFFFFFFVQNIDCGYSLEPPRSTNDLCFEQKYEKYQTFSDEISNFYIMDLWIIGNVFSFFCQHEPTNASAYESGQMVRYCSCKHVKAFIRYAYAGEL